jgi:hypothetical protein
VMIKYGARTSRRAIAEPTIPRWAADVDFLAGEIEYLGGHQFLRTRFSRVRMAPCLFFRNRSMFRTRAACAPREPPAAILCLIENRILAPVDIPQVTPKLGAILAPFRLARERGADGYRRAGQSDHFPWHWDALPAISQKISWNICRGMATSAVNPASDAPHGAAKLEHQAALTHRVHDRDLVRSRIRY